jgi:hypothetical protein
MGRNMKGIHVLLGTSLLVIGFILAFGNLSAEPTSKSDNYRFFVPLITKPMAELPGDPVRGRHLFTSPTIGPNNAPGCIACHSLELQVVIVGPSMFGVATRAEYTILGLSGEQYLRQSIVEPDAYIVTGFNGGFMYSNYGNDLTGKDVDDLVSFLMTLR